MRRGSAPLAARLKSRPVDQQPEFTPELALKICEHIASGMSLYRVCREVEGVPYYRTVRKWELTNREFGQQLRVAREIGCHIMAEECIDIADAVQDYTEVTTDQDGKKTTRTYNNLAQSKMRIDTRLRLLAKWMPLVYGDKVDVNHSGNVKIDRITRRIIWPGQPGLTPPTPADPEANAG